MVLAGSVALSLSRLFGSSEQAVSMTKLLERVLSSARKRISEVDRKFFFVERGGEIAVEQRSSVFDDLSQAVRDSIEVTIKYTHNDGRSERLHVRPLTILIFEHQLYVMAARCPDGEPYPYRVSRISEVITSTTSFEYPTRAEYDPEALFRHVFGMHVSNSAPIEAVRVRLEGTWASYALTHRWHKSQEVKKDGKGVIVTLHVRICPEVETWILGFGEHAEVLAPLALRERVASRLRAAQATYQAENDSYGEKAS